MNKSRADKMDAIVDGASRLAARIDAFEESKHSRANNGEFGKGGSQKPKGEDFSFTDPKRPLFGPDYQETKRRAQEAMANLRKVMSEDPAKNRGDGNHLTSSHRVTGVANSLLDVKRSDVSVSVGKTNKQLASELRRSAQSDRSGRGKKPLPGRAHGEPDEWSFKSAARQDIMAQVLEKRAASGEKMVSEEGLAEARAAAETAGVGK